MVSSLVGCFAGWLAGSSVDWLSCSANGRYYVPVFAIH